MFSGEDVPCVGVSIGVERIFAILEAKQAAAAAAAAASKGGGKRGGGGGGGSGATRGVGVLY
jgi:hypothetical protein